MSISPAETFSTDSPETGPQGLEIYHNRLNIWYRNGTSAGDSIWVDKIGGKLIIKHDGGPSKPPGPLEIEVAMSLDYPDSYPHLASQVEAVEHPETGFPTLKVTWKEESEQQS